MKDGGPAFPHQPNHGSYSLPGGGGGGYSMPGAAGMSLRDYFAAAALTGLCAKERHLQDDIEPEKAFAQTAYTLADAMLAEREKEGK